MGGQRDNRTDGDFINADRPWSPRSRGSVCPSPLDFGFIALPRERFTRTGPKVHRNSVAK